jgi:hypothetical protein
MTITSTASGWLFTRGPLSVRIVHEQTATGGRIVIYGPGAEVTSHEFPDMSAVARGQADLELRLLARGYHLAQRPADWPIGSVSPSASPSSAAAPPVSQAQTPQLPSTRLFWSKRGEVACSAHAPLSQPERWQAEGWCAIPQPATRRGLAYQCPRCSADGRTRRRAVGTGKQDVEAIRPPQRLSPQASDTRSR